ncbi:Serine/threonine-protein kinase TOR [Capsicum baccatum]|uniref:Serine/threonine-protein kinase TOR n=1 Tax=Capsicum baccatum TaxID=33114 RepID=A0A2G2VC45_CAPBA|nr:Serine/threonine-protein kinase TOR [Capsicum baccatum]
MFEATQYGLGRNASVHSIHGSLLAVGGLLRNTGEFMMSRYKKVAEIVLRYLEHRDRLVHLSITSLLPRIAHFLRDQFVTNYLMICMNHILHVLKIPAERASGFIALWEMVGALDGELINYLLTISSHLHGEICFSQIAPRRGRPSLEELACVGNISKAMGPTMEPHVRGLLDSMFSSGLFLTLVEALEQITESIPPLLPTIQNWLLEFISTILSRSYHSMPRYSASGYDLLEFARESVVVYLEDEDEATRKDVALCCCKLVANSFSAISSTQFSPSRINRASEKRRHRVVEEVNGVDSLEKDVEQGKHDLVETEKFSVVPVEGNESDSSERDLDQGLTTSNIEIELAESKSFIADNALESMIDNPESIVKEISAVEEAQPLETMDSPIKHDEENVGAYKILRISSLVLSLLADTVLYMKRRTDKTLHPVAVSSKKFTTHHVVKEKHYSQNWPTEVDVAGARRPSEMSIFQISSSHSKKYPKSEDDVPGVSCPSDMSIFQISSSHSNK